MVRSFRRSVFFSVLILAVGVAGLAIPASIALAAPTTCGGVVFHDYDADGERNEDYSFVSSEYSSVDDEGVPGIDVLITAADGSTTTTTTDGLGAWSASLDTGDFPIRVDFSGLASNWSPTPNGPDSASLNQFIPSASDCGTGAVGNAGVTAPGSFCENRPELVTSCFLFGNVAGHDGMAAVVSLIDGAVDNSGTSGSGWQVDPYTVRATLGEVGTVYGMDTAADGTIYAGSFVKRHAQLGPTNNPTTIYRVVGTTPTAWFTTDGSAADPHSGDTDGWLKDYAAYDDVGRQGLGDVELSADGTTLYTIDLGQKQLVSIPINADGSANAGGVTRTNITAASLGISTCANSDIRPFALGWDDARGLLVGATCSAESTVAPGAGPVNVVSGPALGNASQLAAWIFTYNGAFSKLVDVPLPTTNRGTQNGVTNTGNNNYFRGTSDWRAWVTEAPFATNMTGWPAGGVAYAQPLLSDIELDGDDMVVGFMDIWAHQVGSNSTYLRGGTEYNIDQPISSGDTIRAVSNGSGGFTFPTTGPDFFYTQDNYGTSHSETTLGSAAQIPGRPYVVTNSFDPIDGGNTWQSGGLEWHSNVTAGALSAGDHIRGYRLYDGRAGLAVGTFEKAAGIGDVQALCGEAPIEVGNRVWFDANRDGIANPAETALSGVAIELVDNGGAIIASTSTDGSGLYTFRSDSIAGFDKGGSYSIRIAQTNYDAGGVFASGGAYENQGYPTVTDSGADDGNDSDAVGIAGLPTISFTATSSDHTLDFGVVLPYDLALSQVYTSDTFGNTTDGLIEAGTDVTFTITVTNQGEVLAGTYDVVDYIPTGFSLNDAAWTDNGDGTATFSSGPLAASASEDITITLTADTASAGDFVNWAEISVDDDNDIDSIPDTDQANDDQPTGPGQPGDNVIDNTGGDEDDHDPAGVTVIAYDLALTKTYTADTFGNTSDGVVENGEDVTFTLTVTNQGTVTANSYELTDYIPAGFVLNDSAWTDNGDGTVAITRGPLAASVSESIPITLTAVSSGAGEIVNWAEISNDDGNDADSTPDTNQANDDQPTGPGQPGDDVIDNTGGDEDDHDPAGVTVDAYDLALAQVYTSDTFGNTTDGLIEQGADVTFTITVTNQGTVAATSYDVVDYLPAGFSLNDAAWTDNGDGTATFSSGPLAASASEDISITLTATSTADAAYVNWAEISSDDGNDADSTPDTNQANDNQPAGPGQPGDNVIDNTGGDEDDHDPAGVNVGSFDLALTKSYTSDTFGNTTDGVMELGADVTFTIEVTNQGTIDAGTYAVTDHLPTGFVLNDAAWTDNGNGTATIAGGPLAAATSEQMTITLAATTAGDGSHVNWAEISSDDGNDVDSTPDTDQANDNQPTGPGQPGDDVIDNSGGDEDDHDPAGVAISSYDLALAQVYTSDTFGNTTDALIETGSDVTFTITVTNQGTAGASSYEITDYIPTGFSLNDAAWTDNGDGTATFSSGPLAASASEDITITLTADTAGAGDIVNWAEISVDDGNDVDSTPDTDQANDAQPTGPGQPGDDVIDNSGGDEDDHDPAGVTVIAYDLALTKTYTSDTFGNTTDGVVENGSDVTFTITVFNQGTVAASSYDVVDYLPTGFLLNDAAWTDNGDGTATFTGGPLAASTSEDITITLAATTATVGAKANWAEISSDDGNDADSTPDTNQANDNQPTGPGQPGDDVIDNTGGDEDDHDVAGFSVANYDLALTQIYTSDTYGNTTDGVAEFGSDVTFTITVTNQGTVDASNFSIVDYMPPGLTLNDAAWTDNGDGTATITRGPLAASASEDITISFTVSSTTPGDLVNWAEISIDDGNDADSTPDTNQANDDQPTGPGQPGDNVDDNTGGDEDDHDPAGITVEIFDLALTKDYTSDTFGNATDGVIENGADVTYTIDVTNQGTIDATTYDIVDYIPTGFSLNDAAWTDNGDGTATFTSGPLAASSSEQITITLRADSVTPGMYANWAEISSDDGTDVDSTPDTNQANDNQPSSPGDPTDGVIDNTGGDEDDHDPAAVGVANYDLALTKSYTSDTFGNTTDGVVEDGSDVTFTIAVFNQGTIDANTYDVIDYIPTGFTVNDAAWTDNGDGTATFSSGPLAASVSEDITITLRVAGAPDGAHVNWAEISADDGNDIDSTPDTDQANDNQPAAPGDPTDDETGNAGGDSDDHDLAGITVASYDLALRQAYTSDTFGNTTDGVIENGADVAFTITVVNQGTVDATSYDITNYIPAGFSLNDAAWTDNGDGTATFSSGPLAASASEDITITLTADTAGAGDLVNWAEISVDDGNDIDSTPDTDQANDDQPTGPGQPGDDVIDNTGGDEDDHDPAGVTLLEYDLALAQVYTSDTYAATTDGVIEDGTDVTFTITVINQGSQDATSFEVVDYLPAGFDLNDAAWTDNGDGTVSFNAGPLPAGSTVDIPLTLTANGATDGDHVNWAEISVDDGTDIDSTPDTDQANDDQPTGPGQPGDNVTNNAGGDEDDHDPAGVTVGSYDLALSQVYTSDTFGNATDGVIENGADVTFTITVVNQGTLVAASYDVTNYIPAGFSLNDAAWTDNGDGTATITRGPLAASASEQITITLTADAAPPGAIVNWAEISSDDGMDVDSTPDTDQTNDDQPTGPGQPGDDVIDNTGGDEDDHDPAGVDVAFFDLALTKVYTSDTFGLPADGVLQAGSDVTFTVDVINQGTVDATTFDVTDTLPAGFVLNDSSWTDNGDGTATISSGPLSAGSSTQVAITMTAVSPTLGGGVNIAEISSDDGNDIDSTPDTDASNDNQPAAPGDPTDDETGNAGGDEDDHDIAGFSIVEYDLALSQVYASDTFGNTADGVIENGADVTFEITVVNQGTVDATTFGITNYIPAGFSLNDPAWTDNGDGTAAIAVGPLAAGNTDVLTITLTADTAGAGDLVNWAEISSDDGNDVDSTPDTDQANDNQPTGPGQPGDDVIDNTGGDEDDHDPAGVTVAEYDLALTKVYTSDTFGDPADGSVENGSDVTFTLTVFNQGSIDASSVELTDHIPSGFVLNDAAWTDNGDGTVSRSAGPITSAGSIDVTITMTASTAGIGQSVNYAEISNDDGNDIDSTPDTDQTNDDQPAAPGDPTDDETGNAGGDEDDHDLAGITVERYDLALITLFDSDTFGDPTDGVIEPNTDVTFEITVTNQGTIDAAAAAVIAYMPTGFVLNDVAWTDNGNGTATYTGIAVTAGNAVAIPITTTGVGVTSGTYVLWAEISADDGNDVDSTPDTDQANDNQPSSPGDPTDNVIDNTGGDEDDHDPAAVGVENFDLALIKTLTNDGFGDPTDGLTQDGEDVTFTITVINQGTLDAASFDVTDHLPTGFVLNDAAWTDNGDGTATFVGGALAASASQDIPITVTLTGVVDGDHVNIAEISSDDGNDVDSTTDGDATNDNQPAAPGDPTDGVTNNALDGAGNPDEDDHDIAGLTVGSFDLALRKVYTSDTSTDGNATDGRVQPGDDVTFTITVFNQGTLDAASFDVTDHLPTGFVLNDAAWTGSGSTATLSAGPLAPGASTDLTITLTATGATPGVVVNRAEVSSDSGNDVDSTPDSDASNDDQPAAPGDPTDDEIDNGGGDEDDHDIAGITVDIYDLELVKAFGSDTSVDGNSTDGLIQVGDDATFVIRVFNQGTIDAANVEVTDYLPAGFVLNDPTWTDNGDGTATRSFGAIAAGAVGAETITLTAANPGAGTLVNWAEISADDGDDIDSTPNTNPDDDGTPPSEDDIDDAPVIVDAYDLALRKVYTSDASVDGTATDGVIELGDDVTFTITVFNQGTAAATNVQVTDFLPIGFELNDSAWTDNGDGTVFRSVGPLAPGSSRSTPITLTAVSAAVGDHVNTAEISSDDGTDVDSTPNTDAADDGMITDDEIDNANGDEDDHDTARLTLVERRYLSLGNVVWFDDDFDGVFDPGEDPAAGVVLVLLDENGDPIIGADGQPRTQTTASDGTYLFDRLDEGTYIVAVLGSNFAPGGPLANVVTTNGNDVTPGVAPDPDDDVDADDNGSFVLGGGAVSQPIVLAFDLEPDGDVNLTVDFGFIPAAGIGSFVWLDNNRDGVQSSGEAGVPNVVVQVIEPTSGVIFGITTTDSDGNWEVTGLPPGDYTVTFDDPEDRLWTTANVGDDATDSDALTNGTTGVVNLSAGEFDPTVDAGIVPPVPPPGRIAFTGSAFTMALLAWAAGLGLLGWALVLASRKPEDETEMVL